MRFFRPHWRFASVSSQWERVAGIERRQGISALRVRSLNGDALRKAARGVVALSRWERHRTRVYWESGSGVRRAIRSIGSEGTERNQPTNFNAKLTRLCWRRSRAENRAGEGR